MLVARVLPRRAGAGKQFDYLVRPGEVEIGSEVRVDLAGRRVGGWVVETGAEPPAGVRLRPVAKVRGVGPEASVVELSAWAAHRWCGRRDALLETASAPAAIRTSPPPALRPPSAPSQGVPLATSGRAGARPILLRLPPAADATPVVAALAQRGPALVVVPSISRASSLASRLRRAGGDVALLPEDWAQARSGAAVVIGARGAAWGPCPGMACAVVVDGHDESLVQEPAPTWNAVDVLAERARRAGVLCAVLSPCPGLGLLSTCELVRVDPPVEHAGWASLHVVDRRSEDPRSGLYGEALVQLVRSGRRVACVLNRLGRTRLVVCASCGEVATCERCGAAVSQADRGLLSCDRCGLGRPEVCARCGSMSMRRLRAGVSRVREELEILSGRPVGEVTAATRDVPGEDLLVGTEALLHRLSRADGFDAVAFLDFDQELLAPRVRAGEEALALLASASRVVGGRRGVVLVQTRTPAHPVLQAAAEGDPGVLAEADDPVRRALQWPPYSAVALISGPGAAAFTADARAAGAEVFGPDRDRWLVKAPDADALAGLLARVPRPAERVRVAVDPLRI